MINRFLCGLLVRPLPGVIWRGCSSGSSPRRKKDTGALLGANIVTVPKDGHLWVRRSFLFFYSISWIPVFYRGKQLNF